MTFSDAIRRGSLLVPQVYGDYFSYAYPDARGLSTGERPVVVGACAIGAAAMAVAPEEQWHVLACDEPGMDRLFGMALSTYHCDCPAVGCMAFTAQTVYDVVPHLNDDHRWTREQIAEWVARVETEIRDRQSAPAPEAAVAAV